MPLIKSPSTGFRTIIAIVLFSAISMAGDINAIAEISINKNINIPKSAQFLGIGSILGPGLVELKDRARDKVLTDILAENNIDLGQIIYTAFSNELHNTTFGPKVKEDAAIQFILEITDYGFAKGWGFGNNMRPLIKLKSKIVDSNNNKLWSDSANVWGGTTSIPTRKAEEWFNNPELIRSAYTEAAIILAKDLLKKFAIPSPAQSDTSIDTQSPPSLPQSANPAPSPIPSTE